MEGPASHIYSAVSVQAQNRIAGQLSNASDTSYTDAISPDTCDRIIQALQKSERVLDAAKGKIGWGTQIDNYFFPNDITTNNYIKSNFADRFLQALFKSALDPDENVVTIIFSSNEHPKHYVLVKSDDNQAIDLVVMTDTGWFSDRKFEKVYSLNTQQFLQALHFWLSEHSSIIPDDPIVKLVGSNVGLKWAIDLVINQQGSIPNDTVISAEKHFFDERMGGHSASDESMVMSPPEFPFCGAGQTPKSENLKRFFETGQRPTSNAEKGKLLWECHVVMEKSGYTKGPGCYNYYRHILEGVTHLNLTHLNLLAFSDAWRDDEHVYLEKLCYFLAANFTGNRISFANIDSPHFRVYNANEKFHYHHAILHLIRYNKHITSLHFINCPFIQILPENTLGHALNNSRIVELTLQNCKMGDTCVEHLAKSLESNKTLRILNLNGNYISYDSALALIQSQSSPIISLDLRDNKILFGQPFLAAVLNNTMLFSLDVGNWAHPIMQEQCSRHLSGNLVSLRKDGLVRLRGDILSQLLAMALVVRDHLVPDLLPAILNDVLNMLCSEGGLLRALCEDETHAP